MIRHHDPDTLTESARIAAVLAGCTCDPDVELVVLEDGIYTATVHHDHGCPLLTRRAAVWN